jgi:Protein of unknown function DUF262/Protein of unknown function (DUF1524)
MAKTLVAHEQAIQKVFSDDYIFRVPDYQRPYSWTTEQARELFEDLLGFVQSNPGPVVEMPTYFLGSIVLIKGDTPDADVVDGQQRLTTLTLLLAAVRANVSENLRGHITKRLYEEGDTFAGTADRFRLTLRDRDTEFFQKYVQRDGGFIELLKLEAGLSDSRRNLRNNARLFQERLGRMDEKQRVELVQFILQRCYLVTVSTPDQDSAYRIFSVLNSRGLDLSATDILKAKIIGAIPEVHRVGYTKKWEDAEEDLGRDDFNTLFGHIRTIYRKAKAKETLLKEFDEYVPEVKTPAKFVDNVLLPMSQAFGELTAAAYSASSHADAVNEYLRWLNRLEFNDWMPPALAFAVRHRDNPASMESFLRDLERLAYYMLVTGRGVNDRIDRFAKVTAEVEVASDLTEEGGSLQLTPPEQLRFYDRLDGPIYDDLSAKARTPVLLRLDSLLSGGGASYDYPVISVEHVLPQAPRADSNWLAWFPDPGERTKTVHRLGNLALLTRKKNSQASNWDFDRKKDSYFKRGGISPFALTTQVLSVPEWLPSVVSARQTELMGTLEKHWRLGDRMTDADWLLKIF